MKMKSAFLAAALAGVLMTSDAEARSLGEMFQECGFGGMVFPDNGTNALISNLLFSWPSATTSGVSSPGMCSGGEAMAAIIIHNSYEHVELDLAAGNGEYLSLLTGFVKAEQQTEQEFIATLRSEFTEYVSQPQFTEQSRSERTEALYAMVVD